MKKIFGLAFLFTIGFSIQAVSETLTLTAMIEGKDLHPDVTGIKMSCSVGYTSNVVDKMLAQAVLSTETVMKKPDGTANGMATVVVNSWVPEAKYYNCGIIPVKGSSTGGFYLPSHPAYLTYEPWMRAKSGNFNITGSVQ